MYFGAAWYPEHWPESRWVEDARLMQEAGMNVCRIAEFAWSTLEPNESHYEMEWLERAIGVLHNHGMAVVLGTPTAAPPAWLTWHHPDTLAVDPNGRPAQHGNRCHVSPNSVTYLKYCRRIVEQMAKHFGHDERVIGWQIDNEYNRVDYSESTRRQFQAFLKEQYETLSALNAHWSTAYWSQTYQAWDEIPLPIGPHNPGLMLAFRHFVTRTWHDFQKHQIDAIRTYSRPEQWITHNFMGWFDAFDHYSLTRDLDFASWDWYVGTGHHDPARSGAIHDLTRGLKRRNFWIMETQPGNVNWSGINNMLNRGEARCMALHAVSHGADALLYWQWRSALGGQEQLHGSLLGADGAPRPFYAEAKQIGSDFAALHEALAGSTPESDVAILHSYDARWSIDAQRHHREFDPVGHLMHYYRPLAHRNLGIDIVSAEAELDGYRLVVAPGLVVLPDTAVGHLTRFVEAGGTLVLTARCGQKDVHNALFPLLQPGPLRELAGVEVEEFYALDEPAAVTWQGERIGQSRIWAELLRPLDDATEIVARYGASNGWLDGGAAITVHPVGENGGRVVTIGVWLDDALQAEVIDWLLAQTGLVPPIQGLPTGVTVRRRIAENGTAITFVLNQTRTEQTVHLPTGGQDLLTGETFEAETPLPPYGARVYRN